MLNLDEDAVYCDFAETYHIYDIERLPARRAAALAVGLGENSRIRRVANGMKVSIGTYLLASIVDGVNTIVWMLSKDGSDNVNRPKSIVAALTGKENGASGDFEVYETGADFEAARRKLIGEEEK